MGAVVPYCPGHTCYPPPHWVKHSQRVGALISVFISETSGSLARLYPWLPGCLWGPRLGTEPLSPSQQALGSGVPGGTLPTGSGQAASEAPCPGPGHAGEELLSPPERVFQVFFNRTHFLFMNESFYCEKKKKKTFPRTKATFLTLSLFSFFKLLFYLLNFGFSMVAKDPPSPFGSGGPAPTVTFGGRR